MNFYTLILIAFSLSADAFTVAMGKGIALHYQKIRAALKIALFFGFFQTIMPVIGYLAGTCFIAAIQKYSPWIILVLLTYIGGKMIYEALTIQPSARKCRILSVKTLLFLSIATSIDALAIGFTFALMKISIILPVIIIGVITFIVSLIGVYIGDRFGCIFKNNFEIAGGVVLITLGIKIFIENMF